MSKVHSNGHKRSIYLSVFWASVVLFAVLMLLLPLRSSMGQEITPHDKATPNQVTQNQVIHDDIRGRELFKLDFETKDFSQWRSACGDCKFSLGNRQFVRPDPTGKRGYSAVYEGSHKRNESASAYLPLNKDLTIKWSLYFDRGFSRNSIGTVSQLIGWQKSCFKGGLFHLKYENGFWGYWLRNIPGKHDLKTQIPIPDGEWVDIRVDAKFTHEDNGYIILNITQGGKKYKVPVVTKGVTFKDCERGPYLKVGLYGSFSDDDVLRVDDIDAYVTPASEILQ